MGPTPSSRRAKIPGNPGTLGSGVVSATPAMVSQMRCTGVSAGVGWNVCVGAVGMAGVDVGGNAPLVIGVPVGARLSVANFCAPCWGSRRFWSAWTCKRATADASALILSRIWSS